MKGSGDMMKIKTMEYVIFDVETTGLSAQGGDRIIEIAALKVKNRVVLDRFHSLINPKRVLAADATAIHGITNDMLADAPISEAVLPGIIDFIGGACVAGHNARFDLGFVCYELAGMGRKLRSDTPVIDTLKMARELLPYLSSYRLGKVAHALGIVVSDTHRAMADVELTAGILERLMDIACDQNIEQFSHFVEQFGVEKPNFAIQQVAQEFLF